MTNWVDRLHLDTRYFLRILVKNTDLKSFMNYCNDIPLVLLLPLLSTSDNLTLQGTLDIVLVMTLHTLHTHHTRILPYINIEENNKWSKKWEILEDGRDDVIVEEPAYHWWQVPVPVWAEMHQQGTLHDIVGKCVPCRTVTQLTGHSSSPTDLPIVPVTQPETHSNKVMGGTLPAIGDTAGVGDMYIMD
ncbi:hypothetical protein E2C01_002106 [Portunus trituberculatus]|uniref:Uncharacterized protein n=1 Tax=Portunus trituberculatus TaxID=210409 RepID=A0A5B7CL91_PORTR|nr:hypothetical protein [Portunus trituberculatus]